MIKKIKSFDYFAAAHNTIWDKTENGVGEIRFKNEGVYHLENTKYPKYFKYEEDWDPRCCGSWYECPQTDYQNYLAKCIEAEYTEIKKLNDMLTEDKNEL